MRSNLPDFSSQCSHLNASFKSHQRWSPLVVVGRLCDAMRSEIGMTITLPGYPMSVIQHYFNLEKLYNFWLFSTHLHSFQVIECDVYV